MIIVFLLLLLRILRNEQSYSLTEGRGLQFSVSFKPSEMSFYAIEIKYSQSQRPARFRDSLNVSCCGIMT